MFQKKHPADSKIVKIAIPQNFLGFQERRRSPRGSDFWYLPFTDFPTSVKETQKGAANPWHICRILLKKWSQVPNCAVCSWHDSMSSCRLKPCGPAGKSTKKYDKNPPTRFGVHSLLFLCSIQNFVTRCPSKIPSPKSKIQDPQNPKSKIPKIQNPKSPKSKIQNPQIPKSKLCT